MACAEPFQHWSGSFCCKNPQVGFGVSDKCGRGMVQTMSLTVNEHPVSKLLHDGGLQRLHSADDVAINQLEATK